MCPHAETTTVSFLYGEAPLAHAEHVAGCADCEEVVRAHTLVASALGPALGALSPRGQVPAVRPVRSPWPWAIGGVALAAAAAAALVLAQPAPPVVGPPEASLDPGPDLALDDLDFELASLERELL
jgi:hypothetical protein